MPELTIPYPEDVLWALQQDPAQFEAEAKVLLAVKLYESGKLSTGLAAQVAGVPRSTFLVLLSQHGISPYEVDDAELDEDLDHARRASGH